MGSFSFLACVLTLSSNVFALPAPAIHVGTVDNGTTVHPGTVKNLIITQNNTINATTPAGDAFAPDSQPASYLNMNLVNYLNSNNVKAYITGLNANKQLVFVQNGQFYYPSTSSGVPVPIPDSSISVPLGGKGSTTSATIPGYLSASRVYFSDGPLKFFVVATPDGPGLVEPAAVNPNDPNAATNYGFAELTWNSDGIFADISFVDFVGLPLGIKLTTTDGSPSQQALGLPSNAVQSVCSDLQAQSNRDGQPWNQECAYTSSGSLVRVLAPIDVLSQQKSLWSGYFDSYVRQVFQIYSQQPLYVNTQVQFGTIQCSANFNSMTITCNGDNRSYAAPSAADIFGCNSGPFAIIASDNDVHRAVVPRLCAAFNRGTFLIGGGNTQPGVSPSSYYTSNPGIYNYYSEVVHKHEWNGLGYAFSYDDVAPSNGQNVAGVVSSGHPGVLTLLAGGYDLA